MSLCHRCEYRALAHECKTGPRFECTDFGMSLYVCYMYRPVKPVILKRQKGDKRPQFAGWMVSARVEFSGVCEDLVLKEINYGRKGKALIWFKPSKI